MLRSGTLFGLTAVFALATISGALAAERVVRWTEQEVAFPGGGGGFGSLPAFSSYTFENSFFVERPIGEPYSQEEKNNLLQSHTFYVYSVEEVDVIARNVYQTTNELDAKLKTFTEELDVLRARIRELEAAVSE